MKRQMKRFNRFVNLILQEIQDVTNDPKAEELQMAQAVRFFGGDVEGAKSAMDSANGFLNAVMKMDPNAKTFTKKCGNYYLKYVMVFDFMFVSALYKDDQEKVNPSQFRQGVRQMYRLLDELIFERDGGMLTSANAFSQRLIQNYLEKRKDMIQYNEFCERKIRKLDIQADIDCDRQRC